MESVGLAREIVSASAKTLNNDDDFNHIIEHALSYTLQKDSEDVSSYDGLRFEIVHEVLDMERLRLH